MLRKVGASVEVLAFLTPGEGKCQETFNFVANVEKKQNFKFMKLYYIELNRI